MVVLPKQRAVGLTAHCPEEGRVPCYVQGIHYLWSLALAVAVVVGGGRRRGPDAILGEGKYVESTVLVVTEFGIHPFDEVGGTVRIVHDLAVEGLDIAGGAVVGAFLIHQQLRVFQELAPLRLRWHHDGGRDAVFLFFLLDAPSSLLAVAVAVVAG